jgi:hypothetical protein
MLNEYIRTNILLIIPCNFFYLVLKRSTSEGKTIMTSLFSKPFVIKYKDE